MSMKSAWAKLAVVVAVAAGVCVEEVRGETSYWLRPGPGVDGIYYDEHLPAGEGDPLPGGGLQMRQGQPGIQDEVSVSDPAHPAGAALADGVLLR